MGFPLFLAIVALGIAVASPILWLRRWRMRAIVARWAAEHRFEVISCEERTFSPFTFTLGKSRNQDVVLVSVVDAQGNKRTCWLKLGNYLFGLLTDEVECQWAEHA